MGASSLSSLSFSFLGQHLGTGHISKLADLHVIVWLTQASQSHLLSLLVTPLEPPAPSKCVGAHH